MFFLVIAISFRIYQYPYPCLSFIYPSVNILLIFPSYPIPSFGWWCPVSLGPFPLTHSLSRSYGILSPILLKGSIGIVFIFLLPLVVSYPILYYFILLFVFYLSSSFYPSPSIYLSIYPLNLIFIRVRVSLTMKNISIDTDKI